MPKIQFVSSIADEDIQILNVKLYNKLITKVQNLIKSCAKISYYDDGIQTLKLSLISVTFGF